MISPVAAAGAESYECPVCKAPAGEPCVSALAVPTALHAERRRLHLHEIQDQVRADMRTGDRHTETPLTVRFAEDRQRLEEFAREHGQPVRRVVREAVKRLLDQQTAGSDSIPAGSGEEVPGEEGSAMTASQVIGLNRSGWLAAFWNDGGKIGSRVIATPERDFKPGLLITWGWVKGQAAPYASFGGDIDQALAFIARYDGYEPVTAYPLRAFCNRCGAPVSLDEGATGWHHDEPGRGDIMPYRDPQPLPGEISKCQ